MLTTSAAGEPSTVLAGLWLDRLDGENAAGSFGFEAEERRPPLTEWRKCALTRRCCTRRHHELYGKLLGADRLDDDLAAPHLVDVRVHQTGDQRLAETEAEATFRFDVTGSAVNRMPAASGKTICCTTTAMWTFQ